MQRDNQVGPRRIMMTTACQLTGVVPRTQGAARNQASPWVRPGPMSAPEARDGEADDEEMTPPSWHCRRQPQWRFMVVS